MPARSRSTEIHRSVSSTDKGKDLERWVAEAYRHMGAVKVQNDVEIMGHQIDVYVEMPTADRGIHRIVVEAKNYAKPVGIDIVSEWCGVVEDLREKQLADEGVLVSSIGFSHQARERARLSGIRMLERADLEAMCGGIDLSRMRQEYLEAVARRCEYLDLGGIAPRIQNRIIRLRTEDIFLPLQARHQGAGGDAPEVGMDPDDLRDERDDNEWFLDETGDMEDGGTQATVDMAALLSAPRSVVLGDPGSGKTTVLRYVAYCLATHQSDLIGPAIADRVPVLIRAIEYSQARAIDSTLSLYRYIIELSEARWGEALKRWLEDGQAVVLVDGLDEAPDAHKRRLVSSAVERMAADYPGNSYLVTSRKVGYAAARLTGDFEHYTVLPLNVPSIRRFLEKWYLTIEGDESGQDRPENSAMRADRLVREIQSVAGLRRFAGNPLLLTIIALVNWQAGRLPSRRVELYTLGAETLINTRPFWRQGIQLETERVARLLAPVAYRMLLGQSVGDVPEDAFLPILARAIQASDNVDDKVAAAYAKEIVGQISEHSGIFRERGFDERGRRVFGFLHLTFTEYFAARFLADEWENSLEDPYARRAFLRQYAALPRWHEVMLLAAGVIGLRDNDRAQRATRFIADILQLNSDYEPDLHRDLLLAGECLADGLRVQHEAAQYLVQALLDLLPEPVGMVIARRVLPGIWNNTAYGELMRVGLLKRLSDQNM